MPTLPQTAPAPVKSTGTSWAIGSDLVDLRGAPCGGTAGFGTTPGAVAGIPRQTGGQRADRDGGGGDVDLTFKTCMTSQIDFAVENDFVTVIRGDGIDARHLRDCAQTVMRHRGRTACWRGSRTI